VQIHRPKIEQLNKWKEVANTKHVLVKVNGQNILSTRNFCAFGVRDLYRGLSGAFFGTIPVALLYFAVYERALPNRLHSQERSL
jgi:hypothetical protein